MKKLLLIATLCVLAGDSFSQEKSPPRFDDFPATSRGTSRPIRVNIRSHPKAGVFRTKLRENAKEGVDFAGHYKIATWGCGSSCISIAIIDAKTGKVYFPPELSSLGLIMGLGENAEKPLQYNLSSKLLIAFGYPNFWDGNRDGGKYYYRWENNQLKLIYSLKMKEQGVN